MDKPVLHNRDLARLREQIAEYSGLDASVLSEEALQQAVARRLVVHALDGPQQYWPLLRPDGGKAPGGTGAAGGEIQELVQLLTNKETFFFREGHHFEALQDQVLPALLAGDPARWAAPGRPLRVWSAGCATGEEPYSLAIALLQYQALHGPFEVEIVATDIDAAALRVAQEGCYGRRSLRLVPEDVRRRYFRRQEPSRPDEDVRFCILPAAAHLVTFRLYNLGEGALPESGPGLERGPAADLGGAFDLVFCRNVSIYFHPTAREQLNAQLAASLREGGYLFVASAETMGHNRGRLDLVSLGNTFLFRKSTAPPPRREAGSDGGRSPDNAPGGSRGRAIEGAGPPFARPWAGGRPRPQPGSARHAAAGSAWTG